MILDLKRRTHFSIGCILNFTKIGMKYSGGTVKWLLLNKCDIAISKFC